MLFRSKQKTAYEIIAGDWSSDVCSSDLLVGTSVLYPLLICIPFGYVNPVARCKLDALAGKDDTHTDGYVLYDWHTVLFPALQCKNDVALDIHNWVRLKFYTQIYTQLLR